MFIVNVNIFISKYFNEDRWKHLSGTNLEKPNLKICPNFTTHFLKLLTIMRDAIKNINYLHRIIFDTIINFQNATNMNY